MLEFIKNSDCVGVLRCPMSFPMRNEKLFSRQGFYSFVIKANAALHKEAAENIIQIILSSGRYINKKISILDLACGGEPIIMKSVMSYFPKTEFCYTGIDINPDQVSSARFYKYPENVRDINIIEGNAWDFLGLVNNNKFDVVFTGLVTHHAIPEELHLLVSQIYDALNLGGVYFNHDFFRSSEIIYLRRPDFVIKDSKIECIKLCDTPKKNDFDVPAVNYYCPAEIKKYFDWKTRIIGDFRSELLNHGGSRADIDVACEHVFDKDYPVSVVEFENILVACNMEVHSYLYNESTSKLKQMYGLVLAKKVSI